MKKKNQKQNSIIYILTLPFYGIYYIINFILKVLMYFCMGCYYSLYGLAYPFIYIFGKLADAVFKTYKKNEKKQLSLEKIAPFEEVNMDSGDEEFKPESEEKPVEPKKTFQEKFQEKYNNLSFVKKRKEQEIAQRKFLLTQLQKDNYRNEEPITYKYVAKDSSNKKVTNYFVGHSKMEVYSYLTNEGYSVLSIETSKLINFIYSPKTATTCKLNNKDLIFWLTQLSTYLKSGIPLTEAMRILGRQMSKNSSKKRLFDSIIYNLTLGEAFSDALAKQGKSFPALLVNMIKTAEATGELEETLDDMANYYTEIENTRKAMISAMSYPTIITVFSIAVVAFILLYVIPQFQDIYTQSGATLNKFTLFIIEASKYLENNFITLLVGIIVIIVVIVLLYKNIKSFRKALQNFAMRLPLFGNIIIYKEMSIFAKTFASLLKNNVFITESISLLSDITNNEIYKEIMFKTINNIAKGDKISTAFKDHWAVPEVAYYMIVTGESTGELASMMSKVADYYQTEHKTVINGMKAFIEPAMIIFLAVVVGGIVMAIILPMFGLYSQIQ